MSHAKARLQLLNSLVIMDRKGLKQCKMQHFDFLLRSHKAMTLSGVQCMSCVPPHLVGGQRLCCKVGPSGVSENLFLGRIVFSGLGKK